MKANRYSGLVLTLNEEPTIEGVITSLFQVCSEVIVLDSGSTDGTREIAERCGAQVFTREFDNYASQRNFGLNHISYENELILMFDADERLGEKLVEELRQFEPGEDFAVGRMRRIDYYKGHPLKGSVGYPTWGARVFRVGFVDVNRTINEEYVPSGETHYFQEHFHHYPFIKGLEWWFQRHVKYASMEATVLDEKTDRMDSRSLFSADAGLRRSAWKGLIYKMPFRPLIVFFYLYIVNMGFRDGKAGLLYCYQRYLYESMISAFRANHKLVSKHVIQE